MKEQIRETRNIRSSLFNAEGTVKLAVKQGKKQNPKNVTKKNEEKEICLNCKDPKCNGNCKKIKRSQQTTTPK